MNPAPLSNIDPNARGGKRRYIDATAPEEYFPNVGEVDLSQVSLTGLADLFGSDKGSIKHNYCHQYSRIVTEILRFKAANEIVIGEVGIACGASLRMWAHHLPQSKIFGFDIRPECASLCNDLGNVELRIGDATAPSTFDQLSFDLFVDDGSHISEHIVQTFSLVWGKIRNGGFYAIEDLSCTYNESYKESLRKNLGISTENKRSTLVLFLDALLKTIDTKKSDIEYLEYHPQLLILRKREDPI